MQFVPLVTYKDEQEALKTREFLSGIGIAAWCHETHASRVHHSQKETQVSIPRDKVQIARIALEAMNTRI